MDRDLNNDGVITDAEVDTYNDMLKGDTQKKLAFIAMWSMIVVTALLFAPVVPVERVDALGDLLTMFYIAQASVVGAYMGVTAYMSRNGGKK